MLETTPAHLVTLVVPTYNRAKLIGATLDSALSQTLPFAEIIVVDDGSTDATPELLASYDDKITVIRIANQGVQVARNTGVQAAKTALVALCDSDDLLETSYAATVGEWMANHPQVDALYCNFTLFDETGSRGDKLSKGPADYFEGAAFADDVFHKAPGLYGKTILFQPFFPTGSALRRPFYLGIGGYNPVFKGIASEDWEFSLRAIMHGDVAFCKTPLCRVRKHSGNDSHDTMRVNLGDANILEYALRNHAEAQKYKAQILASVDQRRKWAFDTAFARGDFEQVAAIEQMLHTPTGNVNFRLKALIVKLPGPLRNIAWRITQRGRNTAAPSSKRPNIILIEPTWDGNAHLPGNLGLLRVVMAAYPDARLSFVGGANQIELMKTVAPSGLLDAVQLVHWQPRQDKDPLPPDVWAARNRLRQLPDKLLDRADLVVMCSATATTLSAITWMGLAPKTCAVLHGNAGELAGWRSKNPIRRTLDLTGALRRYCKSNGKLVVIEPRIVKSMAQLYPWIAENLVCIPHPLLPEESVDTSHARLLTSPIKIGFAGLATEAKGFREFLNIAGTLNQTNPGKFDFRAIGMVSAECKHLDQSVLTVQAKDGLPRKEYIAALKELHYLFVWHSDEYYGNAASGVVYDAVNLGIPLIARSGTQVEEWAIEGSHIANVFIEEADVNQFLEKIKVENELRTYQSQVQSIATLRRSLSLEILGKAFRSTFATRN